MYLRANVRIFQNITKMSFTLKIRDIPRTSLSCSLRLYVFARRPRDTIPDISRRRSLPHRRNPGNNQPLGRKKSNCPLIHADTPPAGMPPRNDVRVGELSSKLNIGARRWNDGGGGKERRRGIRRLRRGKRASDVAHLPFSRDGTIKIKLENKRGAGSYYKVFNR